MLKSSLVALSVLAAVSAFAEDEVTRTDKTDNTVVVVVGRCSLSTQAGQNGEFTYQTTLPVTNCQEYKTYRATVSGKSWNKKYTPIPGTETFGYKLEDATELKTTGPTKDTLGGFQAMRDCEEKRELLKRLADAQAGQAKCQL